RIEFNGNNKSLEELEMAIDYGVGRIIIDGTDELALIESVCKEKNKPVKALMRITPGVDSHTHQYITTGNVDSKFGIPQEESVFNGVFEAVLDSKWVDLVGLHFHVGSQLHENDSYLVATGILLELIGKLKDKYGFVTRELNIGGGFGIRYTEADDEKPYAYFLEPVMEKIKEGFAQLSLDMPAVVIEPGRSIVANAGVTLYTVGTIKEIPGVRKYVSVDGGMTDNIRPALYESGYECFVATQEEAQETVTICGKCCESGDILIKDVTVRAPKRGDLLAVYSTGAYCYSMSSNYNKIPLLPVVMTSKGSERLIVRRQSYEDLISRELV
ncbi:MAG: diaminopimelate decarboxylase, partial [Anaerovoracaceae bacterium]